MVRSAFALILLFISGTWLNAQELYAITGAGNVESILYRINPINGSVLQTIGDLNTTHVTALAFSPTTGALFGHISDAPTTTQLISINPNTAAFSVVGNTRQQVPDMSFRADGTLFAWSKLNTVTNNPDDAYQIDLTTGQATILGESNFTTGMVGLSFAPNGTLYMKNGNQLNTVNQSTGAITFVRNLTGGTLVNALAFDSNGVPYSVIRTGTQSFLATFDLNTGVVTNLGEITVGGQPVNGVAALAFRISAVPEPSTMLLIGSTMLGSAIIYWRRKRRSFSHNTRK